MAGDQEPQGSNSALKRLGVIVAGAILLTGSLASIIGLLIQVHPFGTNTFATAAPTIPTHVDCGGKQQNYTITKGDIPARQLSLALTIHGHQYRSADFSGRSQVLVDLRCDGNSVKLPQDNAVRCNGVLLKYNEPIAGPAWYEGIVPAVTTGGSYTISYTNGHGQTFSVALTAMPAMVITSPGDGARVPAKSPLTIRYVPSGDSAYVISASASDTHGGSTGSVYQSDSGSYVLNPLPTFVPGSGFITLTRTSEGNANPISGSPFGSVTAKYDEVGAVTVTWT
jgi:hypothetical protein